MVCYQMIITMKSFLCSATVTLFLSLTLWYQCRIIKLCTQFKQRAASGTVALVDHIVSHVPLHRKIVRLSIGTFAFFNDTIPQLLFVSCIVIESSFSLCLELLSILNLSLVLPLSCYMFRLYARTISEITKLRIGKKKGINKTEHLVSLFRCGPNIVVRLISIKISSCQCSLDINTNNGHFK